MLQDLPGSRSDNVLHRVKTSAVRGTAVLRFCDFSGRAWDLPHVSFLGKAAFTKSRSTTQSGQRRFTGGIVLASCGNGR
jgi:hypothetical protein